jgi:hypothetical protein
MKMESLKRRTENKKKVILGNLSEIELNLNKRRNCLNKWIFKKSNKEKVKEKEKNLMNI